MKTDANYIHPEDNNNLLYWTKKWGVSIRQLNDAILYTGSLNTKRVGDYIRADRWHHHPVSRMIRTLRSLLYS